MTRKLAIDLVLGLVAVAITALALTGCHDFATYHTGHHHTVHVVHHHDVHVVHHHVGAPNHPIARIPTRRRYR